MATKMTAAKRETGKPHSALTDLRGEGNVPGVVYGYKMETTSIVMSEIGFIEEHGGAAHVLGPGGDAELGVEAHAPVAERLEEHVQRHQLGHRRQEHERRPERLSNGFIKRQFQTR